MQMTKLLDAVQYITDNNGQKKGVLLDLDLWRKVVRFVEQASSSTDEDPDHSADSGNGVDTTRKIPVQDAAMEREDSAFRRMHSDLVERHLGQYVAILNEQLVDHDADQVALYRRTRKSYPDEFVWIAPVNESPDEVHRFRSPRVLNNHL